jgi:Uncharacterized protein conserved in bacteria
VEEKLALLVAEARSAFLATFHPARWPGMVYEADTWEYKEVGHNRLGTLRFREAQRGRSKAPALPQALSDAIKAYIALMQLAPSVGETVIGGARHLWRYMQRDHGWTDFDWVDLRPPLLERFAAFMEKETGPRGHELAPGTRAIRETELNALLEWLSTYGIIAPSCQVTRSAHQRAFMGRRREDRSDLRRSRLPDRRAIEALAELYATTTDEWDRLLLALCGILLITGFRESEARDLPLNCLEVEQGPNGERVRFLYWNRKPAGSTYFYGHRWLSPMAGALAKELVAEVRRLTERTRELARYLGGNDGRHRLTLPQQRVMLTRAEVAKALGFLDANSLKSTVQSYRKRNRHHHYEELLTEPWEGPWPEAEHMERRPRVGIRLELVERVLAARQAEHSPVAFKARDGTAQMLSETLFCVPDDPRHLGRPVAVRKLGRDHIAAFLDGKSSIFARRFDDDQRRSLGMRPHGFRHWLNTLANKAGMSVFLITVWMQRRNEAHTNAYLWEATDLADIARNDILDGRMNAGVADEVAAVPEEEQRDFLEAKVPVAHVGPGGLLCTKDMISEECGRQQACAGCGHVLAQKYNGTQAEHLRARAADAREMGVWYYQIARQGAPVVSRMHDLARESHDAATSLANRIGGGDAE